jgi:RimJ/RimL family protein N-acetyltransferase
MSWQNIHDARLENERVLLRRILPQDRDQLREIALDPHIWKYFVFRVGTDAEFDQFMADAMEETDSGKRIVFCVIDKNDGHIAGSMSYGNLAEKEKRLEIGWSWLGRKYRGAGLNRWAKYLLLEYAFEILQCERVEFKTDVLNVQARKGLRNIGAKEEGVLRSYNFMPDNRRRDAIYYSILKSEWSEVENILRVNNKVASREPDAMVAASGKEQP